MSVATTDRCDPVMAARIVALLHNVDPDSVCPPRVYPVWCDRDRLLDAPVKRPRIKPRPRVVEPAPERNRQTTNAPGGSLALRVRSACVFRFGTISAAEAFLGLSRGAIAEATRLDEAEGDSLRALAVLLEVKP